MYERRYNFCNVAYTSRLEQLFRGEEPDPFFIALDKGTMITLIRLSVERMFALTFFFVNIFSMILIFATETISTSQFYKVSFFL